MKNDLSNKTGYGFTCPYCNISEVFYPNSKKQKNNLQRNHHIVYCSRIEENIELGCGKPFIMVIEFVLNTKIMKIEDEE